MEPQSDGVQTKAKNIAKYVSHDSIHTSPDCEFFFLFIFFILRSITVHSVCVLIFV